MTTSQQHQRDITYALILLAFGVWCLAMAIGCTASPNITLSAQVQDHLAAKTAKPVTKKKTPAKKAKKK